MEALQPLVTQFGEPALLLTAIVPVIVQIVKKWPIIAKLQGQGIKIYEILPIVLSIAGAYILKIPVPIAMGIITGFASQKGYDFVKGNPKTP